MRKVVVAVLAAGVALSSGVAPAAHAEEDPAARQGRFTTPFREDGATYDPATGRFTGTPRGDTGCLDPDAAGRRDCLPAGATQNVLADGRILYWNAIEGSEDLDSPDEGIVPNGGDTIRNDRSRVLSINWADPGSSTWTEPANPTGYFPGSPTEPPLIPGTDNANPAANNDGSLFCADQKQLPDGRILAAGGTNYYPEPRLNERYGLIELEGVRNSRIFDPADNTWKPTGDLNHGRWYPSMVSLADGDVFIASGVTKLVKPLYPDRSTDPDRVDENGDNVPQTETYDLASGTWTDNGEAGQRSLPLFPRLHLLPNGQVYYDAAGQSFNPAGQSYKQALWNIAATYDPATKSWTDLGVPGLEPPAVGGPVAEPGFRGSTFSQALPLVPDGAGDYPKASFLTAGGVTLMSPGSYAPTNTTRINTVDVSGATPSLSTVAASPLNRPRWYSSAVTLPTGQVLAFSGADVDEVMSPGFESPIRRAELFTPEQAGDGTYTGGEWEDVAVAHRKRTYHNVAVLLPDGRVLVGGNAPIPNSAYNVRNNPDLPGREASNNFKDASFELYEPPYLHWGVSRPVIGTMNPSVERGKQLVVPTTDAASIESVVLVRNPSETHLIDGDQRVVVLPFSKAATGDALHVDVPADPAVLPPGPYMLFVNKTTERGLIPSVAKQVFVGTQVPGWARGAATYPTGDVGRATRATNAPHADPAIAPLEGAPVDLLVAPIAARREEEPSAWRHAPWVMVGAALLAVGTGPRRRRESGTIWR